MNNEVLMKQLVRQMKIMNFWVSLFGSMIVVGMVIAAFLLWQVVSFVNETNKKIDAVRTSTADSLNVSKKACEGTDDFSKWLQKNSGLCS